MLFVLTYGICIGLANFGIFVPFINVGLALGTYSQLGQAISHTLISYNRFTAIAQPYRNKQIWSKRNIWLACVMAVLLPVPTAIVKLQVQYSLVVNNATGGYSVAPAETIFVTLNGFLTFSYCATSALISASFEIATFVAYYKLTRAARLRYREDYKLLLYAASQFIGQLLAAFCASSTIVRAFTNVTFFLAVVPYVFHITVDILGLSAPVCLLFTSTCVRSSYVKMLAGSSKRRNVTEDTRTASSTTFSGFLPAVSH